MEAIILAGGLGTRLRSEVDHIPKSMALIAEKPFLEFQLDQFIAQGVTRFILSVGYLSQHIQRHFQDNYKGCEIVYAVEKERLGTGGAIKYAMQFVEGSDVVIANGDSLFMADLQAQYRYHVSHNADATLALKSMTNFERYGTVQLARDTRITSFEEKKPTTQGLINGGLYIFNVRAFHAANLPDICSIEKDFFEASVRQLKFHGFVSDRYFLDIGIPEDFKKAQLEIGLLPTIDKSWTLFLDRDGVINEKRDHDYVKSLSEFKLIPGSIEAIVQLSHLFGRICIVTNQQGIGKGVMSESDLHQIHTELLQNVKDKGGHIDAIYYAPQLVQDQSPMRKPEIGMALQAKKDFEDIEFERSIMLGDSPSDMSFAQKAGIIPIRVQHPVPSDTSAEYTVSSLSDFATLLTSITPPHQ